MLNIESLSIKPTKIESECPTQPTEDPIEAYKENNSVKEETKPVKTVQQTKKESKSVNLVKPVNAVSSNTIDLVPKLVKLPNNWNLGDIELKLDLSSNGVKDEIASPDEHLESEWELV